MASRRLFLSAPVHTRRRSGCPHGHYPLPGALTQVRGVSARGVETGRGAAVTCRQQRGGHRPIPLFVGSRRPRKTPEAAPADPPPDTDGGGGAATEKLQRPGAPAPRLRPFTERRCVRLHRHRPVEITQLGRPVLGPIQSETGACVGRKISYRLFITPDYLYPHYPIQGKATRFYLE